MIFGQRKSLILPGFWLFHFIRNSRSLIFPILLQFGLDPELIRNWIAVNFWQRKIVDFDTF